MNPYLEENSLNVLKLYLKMEEYLSRIISDNINNKQKKKKKKKKNEDNRPNIKKKKRDIIYNRINFRQAIFISLFLFFKYLKKFFFSSLPIN